MNENERNQIRSQIRSKATADVTREIFNSIQFRNPVKAGTVYYLIFSDCEQLHRRVSNERNPAIDAYDYPTTILECKREIVLREPFGVTAMDRLVIDMDPAEQVAVYMCEGSKDAFLSLFGGVFDLT